MKDLLLDIFFPKKCVSCRKIGGFICENCFARISFNGINICTICNKHSIDGATHPGCLRAQGLNGVTSSITYKGVVKKLIYQFKYSPYLSSLNDVLSDLMHEGLIQSESFIHVLEKNPLIIDVPIHRKRYKARGYNHSTLLAEKLAVKLNLEFIPDVLLRLKKTDSQYKLSREDRKKNISGAFILNPKFKKYIKDFSVIIVDDVVTSGATLNECAKVLKRSGVKFVWGATLARE